MTAKLSERIKQIAIASGMAHPADVKNGYVFPNGMEEFVALIVKSCADAADMAYDARCVYPGDYVAEYMGFGEDEGITEWRAGK